MFTLLSKLAGILAQFGTGFLALKRTTDDASVAALLLRCVIAFQDLCVSGERILCLAGELADGSAASGTIDAFAALVEHQMATIDMLRSDLVDSRELLATVDASIYPQLAPFLDQKSGLLAKWSQQAVSGRFSTTTLFYLPAEAVDRVAAVGKELADADGLNFDRLDYVQILAEDVRSEKSREIRDLRRPIAESRIAWFKEEIATARAGLDWVRSLCEQLLSATREAVGADAMAHLRRSLARNPSGD